MSRLLSPEEMDALLSGGPMRRLAGAAADAPRYNFRRPDRIAKEQLRSIHFLHDRFALNVSTALSAFLRAMTEVSIVSVEQFSYAEFLMSLPDPTAIYAVGLYPLDGVGALELSPVVAFNMVDRLLGGSGQAAAPTRPLTQIEQTVLDAVVKLLLENLTETWRPIADVQFRIQGSDARPQMLRVTGPNEIVVVLAFDVRIGDVRGLLHVCIPAGVIEVVSERFAQGWHRQRRELTDVEETWLHTNLGRVPIPIVALLETPMRAREVVALQPGDVIAVGHPASSPIDVHVGGRPRFTGRLAGLGHRTKVVIDAVRSGMAETAGEH
jgi:flagellar motor switch protein FliM